MQKLAVNLEKCYGIESLAYEFNFENNQKCRAFSIYARNGLMKTSFAKTFQCIQQGKVSEVCDAIFGDHGTVHVTVDEREIDKSQVFVIQSYDAQYESDITGLLIKGDIQTQLMSVFDARKKFMTELEKLSGLKIQRTSLGKTVFELEPRLIEDFNFEDKNLLSNMEELSAYIPEIDCGDIQYTAIFDDSAIKKITNPKFQRGISQYISATDLIYNSYEYLEKGKFTLPKLKDLRKTLTKDDFFVKKNKIVLSGESAITDLADLDTHIDGIEKKIRTMPEYKEIEKMFDDAKGMALKDVIETKPEIIEYLSVDRLPVLRKCLWASYIRKLNFYFEDLRNKYHDFSQAIDTLDLDDTLWKRALDIFRQRFSVPFSMEVVNLKGAVIGESVPRVEFTFSKDQKKKSVNRSELDKLNTLSQGEKRALYLLNIIFDIEQLKQSGKEVVLIIDDIADSFDYKNKYAIIEYLYEISQEPNFYSLILTHNYDFYRTIASRLNIHTENRLIAERIEGGLMLRPMSDDNNPFDVWKKNPNRKQVIALIPFIRNLTEYGTDKNISNTGSDKKYLTNLLHQKEESYNIKIGDLLPIYNEYAGIENFDESVNNEEKVLTAISEICDNISSSDVGLENKIILSIGIRHFAEKYMIDCLSQYTGKLSWYKRNKRKEGLADEFLDFAKTHGNQTRTLFDGYKKMQNPRAVDVLNEVNIMTPEHIHLNSFMYEPILDMDIVELLTLYRKVKELWNTH